MEPNSGNSVPSIVAANLYMTARNSLSFDEVARISETDVDVLKSLYPTRADLLRSYYTDGWLRYVEMETSTPDFAQFSLAEKLTTVVFSLCDEFEATPGFAMETYGALVQKRGMNSEFVHRIRDRIRYYTSKDENVSMLIKYLPGIIAERALAELTIYLINERVHDRSDDKERTSALTDKATTFAQSAMYTGAIDHMIDLVRYLGITYYSKK
jgi:hypothetical protein